MWLAWVAAHGMRLGWSSSVLARLRWRLFLPYALLALGTLGVGIGAVGAGGLPLGRRSEVTGPVASFGWLLRRRPAHHAAAVGRGGVRLPRLPEPGDRGVDRASRGPAPVIAAVADRARCSPLAHVPRDSLTFLDRFAFGLAASAVVWLTGGLEAAIVLHAVNNVLVFVLAGALGEGVGDRGGAGRTGLAGSLLLSLVRWPPTSPLVARSRRRLRAGDADRRAGPAAARRRRSGRPPADPPTRGGCHRRPEPSGIVFCGAARCHPWGMG